MPSCLRIILCVLIALVASLPATAASAAARKACPGAYTAPTGATLETARTATLCLLNNERAKRRMKPLRANRTLQRAADAHSADMARNNYFAHDSRNGSSFMDRITVAGYDLAARTFVVAENIAWGQQELSTPGSIVRSWMNSPGHRANILNRRLREVGVGIAMGDPTSRTNAGATYTTDFGTR